LRLCLWLLRRVRLRLLFRRLSLLRRLLRLRLLLR
jgi:hypothetical protein